MRIMHLLKKNEITYKSLLVFEQVFFVCSPERQLPSTSSGQALLVAAACRFMYYLIEDKGMACVTMKNSFIEENISKAGNKKLDKKAIILMNGMVAMEKILVLRQR